MDFTVQWRLKGDEYGGNFGNGFTLSNGESFWGMKEIEKTEDKTVFKGKNGHKLTCFHKENNKTYELKTVFENETENVAELELLSSFAINGITADRIHRATSFWSAEGKLLSQDLTQLNMEPSWANHGLRIEKFGQIGSMPVRKWFPFLVLEDSKNSNFLGVQLYCPSSWQIEIITKEKEVSIYGGLADRDFGQWTKNVKPNEKFAAPKAVVAEGKTLLEVCDKLVKAQKPDVSKVDEDMPVVFNEYCSSWGNPNLENIKKAAAHLEGSGVKYFVIDSGWYKLPEDDWFSASGDWIVEKSLFPNGIKEVSDIVKSHEMIAGIWFEYETLGSKTKGYNMTEHLLKRDGYPVSVGGRRFWDMRDSFVKSFLDERVVALLKDNGFGYIKVDYNENIGAGVDGAESYGEGLRQTVEESRNFYVHMKEEIPDLVIENCSSGGHRLEPSFMEVSSMSSFSDAHECSSIPLIAANLHRLIRPEQSQIWAVIRKDADEKRINYLLTSAFLGRLCLSGEVYDLPKELWNSVLEGIKFYSKIKRIIKNGATTVIRTNVKDYSKPQGYQAVLREFEGEALLIVHTFEDGANPDIEDLISGYKVKETFGSDLTEDFSGKAYLLYK